MLNVHVGETGLTQVTCYPSRLLSLVEIAVDLEDSEGRTLTMKGEEKALFAANGLDLGRLSMRCGDR